MILDEICEHKRGEVNAAKAVVPLSDIEDRIENVKPACDFREWRTFATILMCSRARTR